MDRPIAIGVMGFPKMGKTHFGLSVFKSDHIDPKRVLYFDNHGSTDTFTDLHQYTKREPWGVLHIDTLDPNALYKKVREINTSKRAGKQLYDAIIVDDWSEFAQMDIEHRHDMHDDWQHMMDWRDHAGQMRSMARLLLPRVSGAHHIAIFQCAHMPDPKIAKPQKVNSDGKAVYTPDTRPTLQLPFLQGAFGAWFPYKLDGTFAVSREEVRKGGYKFKMLFVPHKDIGVENRWLEQWINDPKLPKELENPSFDKVLALLNSLPEEENYDDEKPAPPIKTKR